VTDPPNYGCQVNHQIGPGLIQQPSHILSIHQVELPASRHEYLGPGETSQSFDYKSSKKTGPAGDHDLAVWKLFFFFVHLQILNGS
jgi:hypothetical protein